MTAQSTVTCLELRCPACRATMAGVHGNDDERRCLTCGYTLRFTGEFWDARVEGDPPAEFAAQWRLWESGVLRGETEELYGCTGEQAFIAMLNILGLDPTDLAKLRILEIGFGHGRILGEIQKHCPEAYGIDLVRPLVSASLLSWSVVLGSLFRMPWAPGQFDLVICRGVIHHTPDVRLAFSRIAEPVSPGGRLCLYIYEPHVPRSLLLRKLIPYSWLTPERCRVLLSQTLGAVWAAFRTVTTKPLDIGRYSRHLGATTLGVFDILSPRITTRHTPDEVLAWFREESLSAQRLSACNYIGERARLNPQLSGSIQSNQNRGRSR